MVGGRVFHFTKKSHAKIQPILKLPYTIIVTVGWHARQFDGVHHIGAFSRRQAVKSIIFLQNPPECTQECTPKAYGTRCSQAVPHPSTILARRCLTSVIGRERVCSSWYGRRRRPCRVLEGLDANFDIFEHFLRTPGYARRGTPMHAKSVQMM